MSRWILLRGLMREARHWGDFPQQLQQVPGVATVITPDFPGNGSLHQLASLATIDEMVEFLRADLLQRHVSPPYHVLALSLGAMVAVAWAAKYPAELEKLVLINTSLAPYSPFYQRLRPVNYPAILCSVLLGSLRQRERLILRLTSSIAGRSAAAATILQQWVEYANVSPVTHANMLRQLRAAIRYRAPLHAPEVLLLLMCAQQDQLVNAQCTLTLAEKWQCELRVHPQAGHDLPLDDPGWVVEQVMRWIDC